MKNNKLEKFFIDGNIVVPLYLLKNYKSLKIGLDEFIFLMYLYNKGNKCLFDPDKYAEELNLDLAKIMEYVGVLTDKGLVNVEVIKNDKGVMEETVLLDNFYDKVSYIMMEDYNKKDNDESEIFQYIEKEFGRTLGSIEIQIINAWLESNISEDLIKEALKEAVLNGVTNLKYMDTILYEWGKDGVKTVEDVEKRRKKRRNYKDKTQDIDMDIVDWNWFDDDEE